MAWLLRNPLADYIPVLFPKYPIGSSLADLLALLVAMLAMTWAPSNFFVSRVLRVLLPGAFVFLYGPVFITRVAYVAANVGRLSPDRALYSLVNLLASILLFVISFGLILREAGLKLSSPTSSSAPQAVSRFDAIYFSFVAWTTVGFGDIVPATATAKVVVMIEVVFGYLMFGLLLLIFPALAAGISETYFRTEM